MSRLADIGEFGLIKRFAKMFNSSLPGGYTGIGDDCAIIQADERISNLVTTDMLIEDRHFIKERISPNNLGYKSLAVNLSDIAAMGGAPKAAFLSIGIPSDTEVEWLDSFFYGINELAEQTNTLILGGDTTQSTDKLVINFTVLGTIENKEIKTRDSAKPGDVICVTGMIGDSAGGLQVLLDNLEHNKDTKYLIDRHVHPRPHILEGRWLAFYPEVNAMIDVSDGIESDIKHIIDCSHTGAEIYLDQIPLSESYKNTAENYGWNPVEKAISGGEDYCLMCTISEDDYPEIANHFQQHFSRPLYPIGKIIGKPGQIKFSSYGKSVDLASHGFDHFKH